MRIIPTIAVSAAILLGGGLWAGPAVAAPKPPSDTAVLIRDCVDVPNRDVGRGSTGEYVREVQCLLNWAIAPSTFGLIAEDAQFGSITERKVIKFQQCANALGAGLAVDGRVGPRTAPHLEWWAAHSAYIC